MAIDFILWAIIHYYCLFRCWSHPTSECWTLSEVGPCIPVTCPILFLFFKLILSSLLSNLKFPSLCFLCSTIRIN